MTTTNLVKVTDGLQDQNPEDTSTTELERRRSDGDGGVDKSPLLIPLGEICSDQQYSGKRVLTSIYTINLAI